MLIITEKPSVAKQFASALKAEGKGNFTWQSNDGKITITHCRGHLLEAWDAFQYDEKMKIWNMMSLPVIPKEFRYKVIAGSSKILQQVTRLIKEAVKKNEEIMIATDAGREGEVIGRLVLEYAKVLGYGKLSRFWVSESTAEKKVVLRGIEERKALKEYDKIGRLGLMWKRCDWVYGINLTVLFTLLNQRGGWQEKRETMNMGRVQTAVLNEVYRRQKEVENFVPEPYRELEVETEDGIKAYLVKPGSEDKMFGEKSGYIEGAEKELLRSKTLLVRGVENKNEDEEPPLLYNTSELQKEAYRVYGYDPAKTLSLMQKLYEEQGTLSYPRTPSRVLGEGNERLCGEWLNEILKHEEEIGKEINRERYTVSNKRLFNNAKLEDHYGLVPLKYMEDDGSEEYKVWKLVMIRFLMQGIKKYEVERNKIVFEKGQYVFIGKFKNVVTLGWKKWEEKKKGAKGEEGEERELHLKKLLRKGMLREVKGWKVLKLQTQSPLLHNYASIIAFMQNPRNEGGEKKLFGIGTEATRASHVKGLEKHELMKNEKGLKATSKGIKLLGLIGECGFLKNSIEAKETTEWEELGEKSPEELLLRTEKLVWDVVESMKGKGGVSLEKERFGTCPKCGKEVKISKYGIYCEDKAGCGFTIWRKSGGAELSDSVFKELLLGNEVKNISCVHSGGGKHLASFSLNKDYDLVKRF